MADKTNPSSTTSFNRNVIIVSAVLSILFAVAGYFIGKSMNANAETYMPEESMQEDIAEMREGGYQYINPLLECDRASSRSVKVVALEKEMMAYIQGVLDEKKASVVSVYFRDLNNGPWIGINEDENYSPASLFKVPILIAVLKKTEVDPQLLTRSILYEKPVDQFAQNISDKQMIQVGNSYTVEDLLIRMIEHSDNEAKNLLFNIIGESYFQKINNDLGLYIPGILTENFLSVRNYSSFFRILYNATYLNKPMSEKALEILSHTNFTVGIVAGVPKGTVVAHKFGERGYADTNIKQLHDCGIIYPAKKPPYLLCVMTRGTNFDSQAKIIADISGIVFENLNK
jgi:beta-lactamase class A